MARKRMILSLDADLHNVLMEFANATGQPAASVAVSLLEEMKPQLEKLTKMVSLAKANAVEDAHDLLTKMSEDAEKEAKIYKEQIEGLKPSAKKDGSE